MNEMNNLRLYLFLYLLLISAHVAFIWSLDYIPTQDGPSHIYNLAILHDLLNGGENWGTYYEEDLRAVPNLGFQIFTYPFLSWLDPWQAEKAFLTLYVCLLALSIPLYLIAFGCSAFPACFITLPLAFSFPLLMGFYSYCIGIPFFFLFFSLAWITRNTKFSFIFFVHIACGVVLFFIHLIPFVFYILSLITISFYLLTISRSGLFSFTKYVPSQIILLIVLVFYLSLNSSGFSFGISYIFSFDRFIYLLIDFLTFSTFDFSFYSLVMSIFFIYIFFLTLYSYYNHKYHSSTNSLYLISKPFFLVPAFLVFIYFIFPFNFGGGAYFNQRIPWVVLLLILPLMVNLNIFRAHNRIAIYIFLVIMVSLFNFIDLRSNALTVANYTKGLHIHIPENSLILGFKQHGMDNSRVDILMHATAHYALKHQAIDIGNYEAHFDYFPVQFNKSLPPVPPLSYIEKTPDKIDLNDYPDISYIILWNKNYKLLNNIDSHYDLLFTNDNVSIWERL
ncbi:MAG: hypothetical protein R6U11_04850 [Bacteroidales bacterium]